MLPLLQRTKRIMAEKVVKYFEDRVKSRDSLAEKLRSKNSSLKVKRRKLQIQLKQKDDAGEVRNEVDFKQLQIENQQLNERCEEKNHELLRLKVRAAKALQILNTYKKKLHALSVESRAVEQEIEQRRELLARVDAETTTVTKEKEKAEAINATSRQKLEDYKVPDVSLDSPNPQSTNRYQCTIDQHTTHHR
jgi:chromosome segregation ATPase